MSAAMADMEALVASEAALREELNAVRAQVRQLCGHDLIGNVIMLCWLLVMFQTLSWL